MKSAEPILQFVDRQLRQADTVWSIGSFGAVAEFKREPAEDVTFHRHGVALSAATARGGVDITAAAGSRFIASESLTAMSWDHRVALCLPRDFCAMNGRHELTEIGPDDDAIRDHDRDAILFDLGLGLVQIDACVRTSDPTVVTALRRHVGKSVLGASSEAMDVISHANPHRVFISRVGRIEVFQPALSQDRSSPNGPGTRIQPELTAHRRTHAATEALPGNWIPCAHFHPPHPVRDNLGHGRPFDARSHFAFFKLLEKYGNTERFALKKRLIHAVMSNHKPFAIHDENDRFSRATALVTLRQLKAWNTQSDTLAAWLTAYERLDEGLDEPAKLPQSLLALVATGTE